MNKTPFLRAKDFDHEDVENPLRYDLVLTIITNMLAGIGVFASGLVLWAWWWLA